METRTNGRITAVVPDPRRTGVVRVAVDGSPCWSLAVEVARQEGLRPGLPVDPALARRLEHSAAAEAAYRVALRALERRPFARADLGRRLTRKGHGQEAVETALARAAAAGFLDDAAFARHYVETRVERGMGPLRLRRDLAAMGVDRGLVQDALDRTWPDGAPDGSVPRALASRRAAQMGKLPRAVKRRRLLAFLARRGFVGRDASEAVREAIG